MVPAGCYGAVLHYLKAVADMGVPAAKASGVDAVNRMKAMPCRRRRLRRRHDPRRTAASIHPAYLFEVKAPGRIPQSLGPLQAGRHHPRRGGFPAAGRGRLPAGPQLIPAESNLRTETTRMDDIFGIPAPLLFGQLLLGLINGAFYAMLSLGLAVIFGLLNIINMAHGAQFMMGAFCAWMLLAWAGIGYWWALLLSPMIIGFTGIVLEKTVHQSSCTSSTTCTACC